MKSIYFWGGPLVIFFALAHVLTSCKKNPTQETALNFNNVIPKPVSAKMDGGVFLLTRETAIVTDGSPEVTAVGQYLSNALGPATRFTLPVTSESGSTSTKTIHLSLTGQLSDLGKEGYDLTIQEEGIRLKANQPAGLFHGVQTIRQLMSEKIENFSEQDGPWEIATGNIRDFPRYEWRGAMLDVARHFFGVNDVKRFIDYLAYYKMNTLHLHLSDDQGWRIEIKSWPNLAVHGGSTQVGGGKGGYYTQEQYADLVNYAEEQFITVIPEIDLPGHINAALASYGELNGGTIVPEEGRVITNSISGPLDGKSKPTELYKGIQVGWSTLRLEKPATFKFVNDVMRELSDLTPGPYLHIGGDEARVTKKDDYIKFINEFKRIVEANGKKMIGWEEIGQADVDENTIAQFWNNSKNAQMAAEKGAKILMSPSTKVYIDMKYDSLSRIGLYWAAFIEADDAYRWDPSTEVDGINPGSVIGVEAPLWGETIVDMADIDYLLFPRLPGIAEIGWTPLASRNWDEYKVRLGNHGKRMQTMGIGFYKSPRVPWNF